MSLLDLGSRKLIALKFFIYKQIQLCNSTTSGESWTAKINILGINLQYSIHAVSDTNFVGVLSIFAISRSYTHYLPIISSTPDKSKSTE